jgi:hypothetical protein
MLARVMAAARDVSERPLRSFVIGGFWVGGWRNGFLSPTHSAAQREASARLVNYWSAGMRPLRARAPLVREATLARVAASTLPRRLEEARIVAAGHLLDRACRQLHALERLDDLAHVRIVLTDQLVPTPSMSVPMPTWSAPSPSTRLAISRA